MEVITALILTRQASVGWPFSTAKYSRAASKSVEISSGDIVSELACCRCREWPVGVF